MLPVSNINNTTVFYNPIHSYALQQIRQGYRCHIRFKNKTVDAMTFKTRSAATRWGQDRVKVHQRALST